MKRIFVLILLLSNIYAATAQKSNRFEIGIDVSTFFDKYRYNPFPKQSYYQYFGYDLAKAAYYNYRELEPRLGFNMLWLKYHFTSSRRVSYALRSRLGYVFSNQKDFPNPFNTIQNNEVQHILGTVGLERRIKMGNQFTLYNAFDVGHFKSKMKFSFFTSDLAILHEDIWQQTTWQSNLLMGVQYNIKNIGISVESGFTAYYTKHIGFTLIDNPGSNFGIISGFFTEKGLKYQAIYSLNFVYVF